MMLGVDIEKKEIKDDISWTLFKTLCVRCYESFEATLLINTEFEIYS